MRIAHRNITGTFSGGVSQQDLLYVLQLEAGVVPGIHAGGCLRPLHKVPGPWEDGLGPRPAKPVLCTVYTDCTPVLTCPDSPWRRPRPRKRCSAYPCPLQAQTILKRIIAKMKMKTRLAVDWVKPWFTLMINSSSSNTRIQTGNLNFGHLLDIWLLLLLKVIGCW